jgi:hypothetical protein
VGRTSIPPAVKVDLRIKKYVKDILKEECTFKPPPQAFPEPCAAYQSDPVDCAPADQDQSSE